VEPHHAPPGSSFSVLPAKALDRAEECKALIDEYGAAFVVQPSGMIRENPLCKTELDNRAFVANPLEHLGVNTEPTKAVGRPTGSWTHEKTDLASA
jgi:hypothetical protein